MLDIFKEIAKLADEHRSVTISTYGDGQMCVTGRLELARCDGNTVEIEGENFYVALPTTCDPEIHDGEIKFVKGGTEIGELLM